TALARDLEIIVQDGRGIGNGRLLPAGPLREPPGRLAKADWLVTHLAAGEPMPSGPATSLPGTDPAPRAVVMRLQPESVAQLASGREQPWDAWQSGHGSTPCAAVAGIGRPERFFAMLRAAGITLSRTVRVPDHQAIPADTLRNLPAAPILITPKDAVKCAAPHDPRLSVVRAAPAFSDPCWLDDVDRPLRGIGHERERPGSPCARRSGHSHGKPLPAHGNRPHKHGGRHYTLCFTTLSRILPAHGNTPAADPSLPRVQEHAAPRPRTPGTDLRRRSPGLPHPRRRAHHAAFRGPLAGRGAGRMSFIVIVPARAASTRLPGKPLLDLGGLPMVVRTARQAALSGASRVLIATDHADIARAAAEHGIQALMTRPDHPTGTDRLSEVVETLGLDDDSIVV